VPSQLFGGCTLAIVAASLSTVVLGARARPHETSFEARRPTKAEPGTPYVPPRTPWGDPDLQGNFTNKYEQSTPFERPEEFDGRRHEDLKAAELVAILEKRQQQVLDRPTGVGPDQFRDTLDVTRGSRAWLIVDPPNGQIPAMTPEARRRIEGDDNLLDLVNQRPRRGSSFSGGPFNGPEDFSLFDRCITRGLPGSMLPFLHGNSYQIVQAPGLVAIRYEIMHETRVIPLDGRARPGASIRLDMGASRGHWEGNTLVIVTTNFKDRSAYRNANPDTLRLIERFTRTAPGKVEWAVTVDDPLTWSRPWTFAMPLTMNDREAVLEFACHEGNYAIPNILSAARTADHAAEDAAKEY
jgi:hypothetical protein